MTGAELVAQASQAVSTYAPNYADLAMVGQAGLTAPWRWATRRPCRTSTPPRTTTRAGWRNSLVPSISTTLAGTGPTVDMSYGMPSVPAIPRPIAAPWPPAVGGSLVPVTAAAGGGALHPHRPVRAPPPGGQRGAVGGAHRPGRRRRPGDDR